MIAEHPNGLQLAFGADGQPFYRRPGMLGWTPVPRPIPRSLLRSHGLASGGLVSGALGFNFFSDVCCDKGSAGGKAADAVAKPFVDAGAAVNNALGGTFIGSAVRTAGKATQQGLDAISKSFRDLGSAIHKIPVIGGPLGAVYDVVTAPTVVLIVASDDIVHGDPPGQILSDSIRVEVSASKAAAPYVESIVALVPGIGGACASAIAVGVGVAEGQPIDQILVAAGAAQIPGGPIVVAGYRAAKTLLSGKTRPLAWNTVVTGAIQGIASSAGVTIPPEAVSALRGAAKFGSDIANGKTPQEAGLDSLVAAIPSSTPAGKAFHSASAAALAETKVALRGSKLSDALFAYGIHQVPAGQQKDVQKSLTTAIGLAHASNLQAAKTAGAPGLAAKLQAVGAADVTPIVAAARAALGGKGVVGFDLGHGLMQYRGDRFQTENLRAALSGDDQHGFDVALALKIGNVASTLPRGVQPGVAAGRLIGAGAQTADARRKAAIHGAVAGHPAVAAGVNAVHTQMTGLEVCALVALAGGAALLVAGLASR